MSHPDRPAPWISSDLHVEVEGLHASMIADGRQLTVVTNDAGPLLAQVRSASLPTGGWPAMRPAARQFGRLLDEAGLSVRVVGERGVLIEAGLGHESRLARILLGTSDVRFGQPAAVLPAVSAYLWARRDQARFAPAGLIVAALAVGAGMRRRRLANGGTP